MILISMKLNSFAGSTLQVMGVSSVGEWSIVGGTGKLAFARGTIKYETVLNVPNVEYYQKLSIYALYTPPSVSFRSLKSSIEIISVLNSIIVFKALT